MLDSPEMLRPLPEAASTMSTGCAKICLNTKKVKRGATPLWRAALRSGRKAPLISGCAERGGKVGAFQRAASRFV